MKRVQAKLDKKDSRILYELDQDARQPVSGIAKKVRLSKQVVSYRIANLERKGILEGAYPIIDTGSLGFGSFYVFFQMKNVDREEEEVILRKLASMGCVGWLVSGTGRWDGVMLIYADSTPSFDEALNRALQVCQTHVHEYTFTSLVSAEHIGYRFLGEAAGHNPVQDGPSVQPRLDSEDWSVLGSLAGGTALSVVDLSKKIGLPAHVVAYRLRSLRQKGVLKGFKPKLNLGKLGLQWHLLLIRFDVVDSERRSRFVNFCRRHPMVYYVTQTIGMYNLMVDLHVKDSEEFKNVLLDFKGKFSDVIKTYESVIIFDELKINYVPAFGVSQSK